MKNSLTTLIVGGLAVLASAPALPALKGDVDIAADIGGGFVHIVGSEDNARMLVTGLRNGETVTLNGREGRTIRITPACGRMGWGNTYIVLNLAQEEFQELGIVDPTPDQLAVVLDGGTLVVNGSPRQVQGILPLCASAGDDWDRVASTIGVSFEPVRDHWRSVEQRYQVSGSSRLEENDRPKGEESWGGSQAQNQNSQTDQRTDKRREQQNQQAENRNHQEQDQQNQARPEAQREQSQPQNQSQNSEQMRRENQSQTQPLSGEQHDQTSQNRQSDQDRTRQNQSQSGERNTSQSEEHRDQRNQNQQNSQDQNYSQQNQNSPQQDQQTPARDLPQNQNQKRQPDQ